MFGFPEAYKPLPKKKKKKKKYIPQIVKDVQEYKHMEIDYAFEKNISYSQFSQYLECPKKWELNYVRGYKVFTSTIHTVFGTALHEALQYYLQFMYDNSGAAADREDIEGMFEEKLRNEYKTQYEKNNKQHFSSPEELREFYNDGVDIIKYVKKHRSKYFSKKGWYLVGCEIPITLIPNYKFKTVKYQGYLDLVMFHEPTNTFKIIDIKTSTRGWNNKAKKEEIKQFQLILYKKFFAELFNIPIENIKIEFFIVKRKTYDNPDFHISRVQQFVPASGKVKLNKVTRLLDEFITEAFDKEGEYKDKDYQMITTDKCMWCPFYKTIKCSATFKE